MNLDFLNDLNESCQKSLIELNEKSEKFAIAMKQMANEETDEKKISELNSANVFIERLFSQAKLGNLSEVSKMTQEIQSRYGGVNKK